MVPPSLTIIYLQAGSTSCTVVFDRLRAAALIRDLLPKAPRLAVPPRFLPKGLTVQRLVYRRRRRRLQGIPQFDTTRYYRPHLDHPRWSQRGQRLESFSSFPREPKRHQDHHDYTHRSRRTLLPHQPSKKDDFQVNTLDGKFCSGGGGQPTGH